MDLKHLFSVDPEILNNGMRCISIMLLHSLSGVEEIVNSAQENRPPESCRVCLVVQAPIVSCVFAASAQHIHEVLCNDPEHLFSRV